MHAFLVVIVSLLPLQVQTEKLSPEARQRIDEERRSLDKRLSASGIPSDLQADVRVFLKGVEWALHYENDIIPKDAALIQKALSRARERLENIKNPAWPTKKGKVVRGYVSEIDSSVQPYKLIVPASYDGKKPMRLDVILHGSMRVTGLNELHFLGKFDEGDEPARLPPQQEYLELFPLGRVENGYRWAGETDIFEAIAAVSRHYKVDPDRIVLRGMSMGASGTWHLGLKHPHRFVALGPYCGYVDTFNFSQTPLKHFVKVDRLPDYQRKMLHMVDSIDYAANAGIVPAIACMGEKDVFFQAHVLMDEVMKKEGLDMVNLISPGTGHVVDPVTHKEQMARIKRYADKGLNRRPARMRFVTWTLKYSHAPGVQVLGMDEHYRRADLDVRFGSDGVIDVAQAKNITRFVIHPHSGAPPELHVEGRQIRIDKDLPALVVKRNGVWEAAGPKDLPLAGKRPGLQGPIDDAFCSPFLCVRGTGSPWHPRVHAFANARLDQFASVWHRFMRGVLPIKDDKDVTADDVKNKHLIVFGDPGSNPWIAKMLTDLPLTWSKTELRMAGKNYSAPAHVPVLIQPNPLNRNRYVVLNSGHTFGEKEFATVNYLLFPRHGDWAVLGVDGDLRQTGFYNEQWR